MAIIGAGQMGTGIGIVGSRTAGLNINFIDQNEAGLKRCENFISNWCAKEMAKDRMK
jgi:3-hydroxybutyryl-CoA dehydrogenase